MTTLAPKLPWQHAFAGGFSRLGGQALPTDADAIDYLNRVATADGAAVEVGVAQAIDAFVKGCKADSAGYAGDPTRTNWDAIQACCVMAGARTISGALVPLKRPYGAELVDIDALPTPTITNDGGSAGVWAAATRTMSNTPVGTNPGYPRFQFPISATVGRRYRVTLVLSGDITGVNVRLGLSGGTVAVNASTGVVDAIMTCTTQRIEFHLNGTLAPQATRIESLSIREDSFTPTAENGWTSNEYSRGGTTPGLKGNGTGLYLDTHRAANADGQDDQHMSVFVTALQSSPTTTYGQYIGNISGSADQIYNYPAGNQNEQYNSRGTGGQGSGTRSTGLKGLSRSNGAQISVRTNGVGSVLSAVSSTSSTDNLHVFKANGGTGYIDARLSYYSLGSACDLAALDSRTTHLMNSIRFTLLTGLNPGDYDPATLAYLLAAYTAGGSLA